MGTSLHLSSFALSPLLIASAGSDDETARPDAGVPAVSGGLQPGDLAPLGVVRGSSSLTTVTPVPRVVGSAIVPRGVRPIPLDDECVYSFATNQGRGLFGIAR